MMFIQECSKIKDKIKTSPINYRNIKSYITVSIGISMCKAGNGNVEELIRKADMNLYRAKDSGKDNVIY